MASVWILRRSAKDGSTRHRVMFRVGGRDAPNRYGGSFRTRREADIRLRWIENELAARRAPDIRLLAPEKAAQTLKQACERWRASRVDVSESTRVLHRVALKRVIPILGSRPVDEITAADVSALVEKLTEDGKRRETIRKSVKYLAAVLEECGVEPNPARSKSIRLPHEEQEEINPPSAEHVEAVYRLLVPAYRLPLLWLDWSGARVPGASADKLRTAIARACRAAGVPVFSPHDLRHRRISLLHRQGRSWAEIARFVGQRKLSITADVYSHVMSDGAELDYAELMR